MREATQPQVAYKNQDKHSAIDSVLWRLVQRDGGRLDAASIVDPLVQAVLDHLVQIVGPGPTGELATREAFWREYVEKNIENGRKMHVGSLMLFTESFEHRLAKWLIGYMRKLGDARRARQAKRQELAQARASAKKTRKAARRAVARERSAENVEAVEARLRALRDETSPAMVNAAIEDRQREGADIWTAKSQVSSMCPSSLMRFQT